MKNIRPMNIGIDCRLWNETGVGRYIRNLVWELAKIDQKNAYTLFFRKNEFDNVQIPGNNFRKLLTDVRWHSLEEQIKMPRILSAESFDLVHFPYFSVPILYHLPFIVTIHDLIINHFPTGKASTHSKVTYFAKLLGYKFVLKKAIQHAKRVISVSYATKKEIIKHYKISPEKIDVTYEGVDEKITIVSSKKPSMTDPYILYVGNGYPHKNLKRLLLAFDRFKKHDKKNVKLVLIGKEDFFYKRLKKIVSENAIEGVLFYEKVSDGGLASLYQHAKAVVIPSLMEGFGLPAIEAMGNRCLVLASNIPSLREICKTAAIYFDPFSIDDIARTIQFVFTMQSKEASERIQQGLAIQKEFSWKTMAAQTLAIYESCISL